MRYLLGLLLLAGCGCVSLPLADLHDATLRLGFTHGLCSGTARPGNTILTAQHCLDRGGPLLTVNGHKVTTLGVTRDKFDTLTIHESGLSLPHTAPLGPPPKQGDRIRWWGNPDGNADVYRQGYVARASGGLLVIDATICHGDSGAGIFNDAGQVVAVVSQMTDENGCTFMLAYSL